MMWQSLKYPVHCKMTLTLLIPLPSFPEGSEEDGLLFHTHPPISPSCSFHFLWPLLPVSFSRSPISPSFRSLLSIVACHFHKISCCSSIILYLFFLSFFLFSTWSVPMPPVLNSQKAEYDLCTWMKMSTWRAAVTSPGVTSVANYSLWKEGDKQLWWASVATAYLWMGTEIYCRSPWQCMLNSTVLFSGMNQLS